MTSGYSPYRSSGYNVLFPKADKEQVLSIKKFAFPKKPSSLIRSMINFTKDKCLELLAGIYDLSAGEKIEYRDEIDKLEFSAYEYMFPHKTNNFDRHAGDIVVISYPDKILVQNLNTYDEYIQASLVGYFYK